MIQAFCRPGCSARRTGAISFRDVKNFAGAPAVPVPEQQRPVFVAFADAGRSEVGAARSIRTISKPSFGKGFRLRSLSLDIVANGFWPIDFGGALGEPVTRGIEAKLPWLTRRAAQPRRCRRRA